MCSGIKKLTPNLTTCVEIDCDYIQKKLKSIQIYVFIIVFKIYKKRNILTFWPCLVRHSTLSFVY